ncbi:hypothetical protein G7Z17_g5794 [Cylindrodendrum hubeiense]|uniref:Transcription factor domain-containing protein n=1 Tax=Cylindrodendrum hubeiense TaxID=595255 RepID=A0A9P5H600_9HYPO|nr:hypothetical protein G7Z17_g5794 [Cylindrodendrum hubeiense]
MDLVDGRNKRRREQPSDSDSVATWRSPSDRDHVSLDSSPSSLLMHSHVGDVGDVFDQLDDDFFMRLSQPFDLGSSTSSSPHSSRKRHLGVPNPLLDDGEFVIIHPMLRHPTSSALVSAKKEVNALIKFRFAANSQTRSPTKDAAILATGNKLWKQKDQLVPIDLPSEPTPKLDSSPLSLNEAVAMSYLPPSFGDVALYNNVDKMLHTFFISAICTGRTVIKTDNAYETAIAPMANTSELVKHSLLSLAATYVMDFRQYPQLTNRSNFHHQTAVMLLGQEIQAAEVYCPKKEDALVAALYILAHNENSSARFSYLVAKDLERLLTNFWQWSDLSEGHATAEEMLQRLSIGSKGKVDNPIHVTEIIAEGYVAAAQIYLQCRVFRYNTPA